MNYELAGWAAPFAEAVERVCALFRAAGLRPFDFLSLLGRRFIAVSHPIMTRMLYCVSDRAPTSGS